MDRHFRKNAQLNNGQFMKRNAPYVRQNVCSICSIPGHYEQHCQIAMYQFQDLETLFGLNMPQQANSDSTGTQSRPQQLAMEQNNAMDISFAFLSLESQSACVTSYGDVNP